MTVEPLTGKQMDEWFPLKRPDPIKHDAYEIALVLAGTVSAGAYTAGVLDFLIEALDAWTLAKQDASRNDVPRHEVVISTIAGASGGAINGAIFTRAASWSFPHGTTADNLFYDTWINRVRLQNLLSTVPDKNAPGFSSILNTASFTDMAENVVTWKGDMLGHNETPPARGYLADPLRLFITLTNLSGTPYHINFRGETQQGHDMKAHNDHVRFGISVPGGALNAKGERPDEWALSSASDLNWDHLKYSALAACAFPGAFPSREVDRLPESIAYRVVLVPGDGTDEFPSERNQLIPNWDAMADPGAPPGMMRTVNVDGGAMNNEPLDLAHTALAGLEGRNPRQGDQAKRGMIMVDPFCDSAKSSLFTPPDILGLLGPLIGALMDQPRFRPTDIALARDENVFSRYLIAPVGSGSGKKPGKQEGADAIASGGLDGFIGFLNPEFLKYDFQLGRRNAYSFLKKHFALPESNSIFDSWTEPQKEKYKTGSFSNRITNKEERFLPLIPIVSPLAENPPAELGTERWPRGFAKPGDLREPLRARLDALFGLLKARLIGSSKSFGTFLTKSAVNTAWSCFVRGWLLDTAMDKIQHGLKEKDLL